MPKVWLLDYGAGNVRSIRNALARLGFEVEDIQRPEQIATAGVLLFPGVGSFGACMKQLHDKGWVEPLRAYLRAGRPFLGICLGMQTLFEARHAPPRARQPHIASNTQPAAHSQRADRRFACGRARKQQAAATSGLERVYSPRRQRGAAADAQPCVAT